MIKRISADIILWLVSGTICIVWRLAAAKVQIGSYILLFLAMMVVWIILGLLFRKYTRSYKELWYWQEMLSTLLVVLVMCLLVWQLFPLLPWTFSPVVGYWMIGITTTLDAITILLKHYVKYALNMDQTVLEVEQRTNARVTRRDEARSPESLETIHQAVLSLTTEDDYQMLLTRAHLSSRLTKIVANTDRFSIMQLPEYQYKTIVDLTLLNNTRGINKRFCMVNQKLPDDGCYVCCYRPQEYVKQKILNRYPPVINKLVYSLYFLRKRVIPRMLMTSRLYYDITRGRKRMLSKTEVLGRLYYCGFVVDEVVPMGHIEYVFAHRYSQPYPQEQLKLYGPLIKLPRVCKNRQIVYFYKFRTMHPYSEYIQQYVFEQAGGMNIADKSDNDWRITSWGRVFRKYWIDELPMLWNFLKGDVKLVGVRPLSRTMFDSYPADLQEKRTRCKPGLIPPFYIDHPKTFDELFASENKYLDEYLRHPFITDVKYFFLTIHSILFRRIHSA